MVQVMSRAIRTSGCFNCRLSLLQTFTAIQSIPSRPAYQLTKGLRQPNEKQKRLFSNFSRYATVSSRIEEERAVALIDTEDRQDDYNAEPPNDAAVPWYLQVEQSSKPTRPLLERQRIPDLPESPPEILEPLLHQISVDLGFDDLAILDLRHIDPPAALGANLLMILGTARSEKHLHVSADRLCRWLRSEYKLRPDADGLLGRNELKLKLRRKNRRAKLLGSGASSDDMDDGVRTGWVCVNIGTVENTIGSERLEPVKEGFIGFGRQTGGVRIVVQMLVEEKREELDLENLWNGIAKRSLAESRFIEGAPPDTDGQLDIVRNNPFESKPQDSAHIRSSGSFSPLRVQSRSFHTTPTKPLPELKQISFTTSPAAPILSTYDQPSDPDLASIREQTISLLESGEQDAVVRLVSANISRVAGLQNNGWRKHLLNWLRSYIAYVPRERAIKELGNGWEDRSSTTFLHSFYHAISRTPSESEWEFHTWLHSFARELGHPGYTLEGFSVLFSNLKLSGIRISDSVYLRFLRSVLQPRGNSPEAGCPPADNTQREFAARVLDDMYDRTGKILTEDVFLALQESLASYPTTHPELLQQLSIHPKADMATYGLPVYETEVSDANSRVRMLMSALRVRCLDDSNRMRFMILYAKQYKWVEFWNLWRSIPFGGESRSPALWGLMFKLVAETKHQNGCMAVLRTWITDMDREEPQVRLEGDVLEGVKACLAVAQPSVEEGTQDDSEAGGEWINLWRRCLGKE